MYHFFYETSFTSKMPMSYYLNPYNKKWKNPLDPCKVMNLEYMKRIYQTKEFFNKVLDFIIYDYESICHYEIDKKFKYLFK